MGGEMIDLWDHVGDVVLSVDGDGRIAAVSPSVTTVLGHIPGDLVATPAVTLIHPDERVVIEAYLTRTTPTASPRTLSFRAVTADGSWTPARAWVHPVEGEGFVLVLRPVDASEERLAESERRALEKLQLVDEMKQRLVEAVAHELRHPLTVISGFAQTLQRPGFEVERELLERIGQSIGAQADRLQHIVDDLIEFDRAGRGLVGRERAPIDVADVVLEAADDIPIGPRQLRVAVTPVRLPADAGRVRRVVQSLLANVAQHTPPGTTAWVRLTEQDGGALLEVSDDGPGLPEEVRRRAFSPFVQANPGNGSGTGIGVGLALVRRYAEAHGGRAWLEDRADGGTTVLVFLPGPPAADALTAMADVGSGEGDLPAEVTVGAGVVPMLPPDVAHTVTSMLRTLRDELDMRTAYLSRFTSTEQVVLAVDGDGASIGIETGQRIPLENTYCVRMVRGEIGHLVPDTSAVPELRSLPATRDGIACYAGVPLRLPDGHIFGTLCCADDRTRPDLRAGDVRVLQTVARLLGHELAREQVIADDDRETRARIETVLGQVDGVQMMFQPIIDMATGAVAGVEALARFSDSEMRPPDVWFSDAARVGLGEQLEQLAVIRALRGLKQLPVECYLAVNLSPDTVAAGGLRPLLGRVDLRRVVLEITEHAAVHDYNRVQTMLRPFRDAGARLAIDDVGSGFASLRHVLRLEPEIIKIDRSLVTEVADDPAQRAVAAAFGKLAAALGTKLVAEGVEDTPTLNVLAEAGITHAQGWLFARAGPLPLERTDYAEVIGLHTASS
ncbi:MAG: EAL domain-containing protein [Actinobacteria bacterium]|nr:EAL domain-containing protein [Actinomycetota bacterium]